jgi:hypothetical protein
MGRPTANIAPPRSAGRNQNEMDKAMPRSANRGFSGVDFLKSCRIP